MKYHLDTSAVLDVLAWQRESLLNFELTPIQDIAVSTIVVHELLQGAQDSGSGSRSKKLLDRFLKTVEVIPFRVTDAEVSAQITKYLNKQGKPIGNLDPFIAAQAIAADAMLVTRNIKHFKRIPNLQITDWSKHTG